MENLYNTKLYTYASTILYHYTVSLLLNLPTYIIICPCITYDHRSWITHNQTKK